MRQREHLSHARLPARARGREIAGVITVGPEECGFRPEGLHVGRAVMGAGGIQPGSADAAR